MVICLELGADLHMAQLMPLPLTVCCFSKLQIGFAFLVPDHPGSPGQRAVKRVCVYDSSLQRGLCCGNQFHAANLANTNLSTRILSWFTRNTSLATFEVLAAGCIRSEMSSDCERTRERVLTRRPVL